VHAIWADGRDGTPDPYYARLTSPSVGVPPLESPVALSLRGSGAAPRGAIRARVSSPAVGEGVLELFDVSGRRLASQAFAGGSTRDVELGGALASGVYLLRASQHGTSVSVRVVALR
jgi:hypothetical protein